MRASLIAALLAAGVALSACTTVPLSAPVATIDSIRQVTASGISPIKVGAFAPGPELPAAKDRSVNSRAAKVVATGGSFAAHLGRTLETELNAAGKLDAASGLEVTGFLVESELHSASTVTADAVLAARFVLKRDGAVVYDKTLRVTDMWKSAFMGVEAIPDAINHYYGLYGTLTRTLLQDPDFIAAAKR
jgi:hypothetical protein